MKKQKKNVIIYKFIIEQHKTNISHTHTHMNTHVHSLFRSFVFFSHINPWKLKFFNAYEYRKTQNKENDQIYNLNHKKMEEET